MLHRKTLIVGVVYCPKGINNESYNFLTNIFQALSTNNKDCVIMGDFNCNIINKYDPSTHDFLSLTTSNSFHPLHYLPTRVNEKSASTLYILFYFLFYFFFMAWLRERRLRRGSSTSPAGTHVADKADAGEACPVAVVAGEGLVWD